MTLLTNAIIFSSITTCRSRFIHIRQRAPVSIITHMQYSFFITTRIVLVTTKVILTSYYYDYYYYYCIFVLWSHVRTKSIQMIRIITCTTHNCWQSCMATALSSLLHPFHCMVVTHKCNPVRFEIQTIGDNCVKKIDGAECDQSDFEQIKYIANSSSRDCLPDEQGSHSAVDPSQRK